MGTELVVSQPCTPVTNKSPSTLGCIQSTASGSREVILPLCSALGRHIWSAGAGAGLPPRQERQGQTGMSPAKVPEGQEHLRCEEGLGEPGLFNLERRGL